MTPISTRLPDELVQAMDQMVSEGAFANRTEVMRAALERLAEAEERRRIDEAIIAGYKRFPPDPVTDWQRELADRSISEEPW